MSTIMDENISLDKIQKDIKAAEQEKKKDFNFDLENDDMIKRVLKKITEEKVAENKTDNQEKTKIVNQQNNDITNKIKKNTKEVKTNDKNKLNEDEKVYSDFSIFNNEDYINHIASFVGTNERKIDKEDINYWSQYISRIKTIETYGVENNISYMANSKVEKAYLQAYLDLATVCDIAKEPLIYTAEAETVVIEELKKQNFNKKDILETINKYSPLQLTLKEANDLYNDEHADLSRVPAVRKFVNEKVNPNEFLNQFLERYNMNYNEINKNDIYNMQDNAKKIIKDINVELRSLKKMNKIRNHFNIVGKISDFVKNFKLIYKSQDELFSLNPVDVYKKLMTTSPEQEYLKQATKLCHNDRIMKLKDELCMFEQNKTDLSVAKIMFSKGYHIEDIENAIRKHSPIIYNAKQRQELLKEAKILYRQDFLVNVSNLDSFKNKEVVDVNRAFIVEATSMIQANPQKVWSIKDNQQIFDQLIKKGYLADKICEAIKTYAPNDDFVYMDKTKSHEVLLTDYIKERADKISNRKLIKDILKNKDKFEELKNVSGIKLKKAVLDMVKTNTRKCQDVGR